MLIILACFWLINLSVANSLKEDSLNAIINVSTNSLTELTIAFRNYECYRCELITLIDKLSNENKTATIDTFYPSYYLFIKNSATGELYCKNLTNLAFQFGEKGTYLLTITNNSNIFQCKIDSLVHVGSLYQPVYIATGVFISAALIYIISKYLYTRKYKKNMVNADFGVPMQFNSSTYLIDDPSLNSNVSIISAKEKNRTKSVDVFRGFSLAIVIFANYGAGGYSSLDHAVWNGLNLSDTVFPCFIFILGVSIPLSFKSIAIKASKTEENKFKKMRGLFFKVVKRSVKLFFFGLLTSNSNYYLTEIRIMGVLQRFALSYFVCACIELIYLYKNGFKYYESIDLEPSSLTIVKDNFKEIFYYPIQWLLVFLIGLTWVQLTFLLPVDNCPTGYLGPGGLHDNGTQFNCTGGSAGYIDRVVLGYNHLYQNPTSKSIYKHVLPHDPEGLLGTLTSICLAYFGVLCGHIIIHYQGPYKRIIHFLAYSVTLGLIGAILCKFSKDDGWIPINKNLWTLSFIFVMAGIAFFILTVFYILIDVFDIYSGTPFLYFGRNSITIYICHIIFQNSFPFFNVENTHPYLLGRDLYGICLWFIVAWLMDRKKVYINL